MKPVFDGSSVTANKKFFRIGLIYANVCTRVAYCNNMDGLGALTFELGDWFLLGMGLCKTEEMRRK